MEWYLVSKEDPGEYQSLGGCGETGFWRCRSVASDVMHHQLVPLVNARTSNGEDHAQTGNFNAYPRTLKTLFTAQDTQTQLLDYSYPGCGFHQEWPSHLTLVFYNLTFPACKSLYSAKPNGTYLFPLGGSQYR